jgi:hypothetical protein
MGIYNPAAATKKHYKMLHFSPSPGINLPIQTPMPILLTLF